MSLSHFNRRKASSRSIWRRFLYKSLIKHLSSSFHTKINPRRILRQNWSLVRCC